MAVPKFQQVVDLVMKNIKSGEWPVSTQLPTQSEWREDYGITYGTLRQAYLVLRTMGLIEGRQGDGVFVKDPDAKG